MRPFGEFPKHWPEIFINVTESFSETSKAALAKIRETPRNDIVSILEVFEKWATPEDIEKLHKADAKHKDNLGDVSEPVRKLYMKILNLERENSTDWTFGEIVSDFKKLSPADVEDSKRVLPYFDKILKAVKSESDYTTEEEWEEYTKFWPETKLNFFRLFSENGKRALKRVNDAIDEAIRNGTFDTFALTLNETHADYLRQLTKEDKERVHYLWDNHLISMSDPRMLEAIQEFKKLSPSDAAFFRPVFPYGRLIAKAVANEPGYVSVEAWNEFRKSWSEALRNATNAFSQTSINAYVALEKAKMEAKQNGTELDAEKLKLLKDGILEEDRKKLDEAWESEESEMQTNIETRGDDLFDAEEEKELLDKNKDHEKNLQTTQPSS
ncbi:hypothetical protein L596_023205 [Steinernema carpocapsae]|uniref:Uncharacterized protein n=1 Tax=Steinernema carpocapsae TaxID=34508 RepID=A0A4U5MCY0_STECR|nr:hypothetical protein L596_023205 [Steinernema carpocapsae]